MADGGCLRVLHPNSRRYLAWSLGLFAFFLANDLFGAVVAVSSVSGYFDNYRGEVSYSEVPVYFTIRSIDNDPAGRERLEVFRYGMRLDKKLELKVRLVKAAIDQSEIGRVFISPELLAKVQSPSREVDKAAVYYGLLDLRGSIYTIWHGKQHFEVHSIEQVPDGQVPGTVQMLPAWKRPNQLYVLAYLAQLLLMAMVLAGLVLYTTDNWRPYGSQRGHLALATLGPLALFLVVVYSSSRLETPWHAMDVEVWMSYLLPLLVATVALVTTAALLLRAPGADTPPEPGADESSPNLWLRY